MAYVEPLGKFTKTIDGVKYTRTAYSQADIVRFRFDGWTEVPARRTPKAPPAPSTTSQTT